MCGGFIGQIGQAIGGLAKGFGLVNEPAAQAPAANPAVAQAAADTSAAQGANLKLADRNRRRSVSLLATGAGDTGMAQGKTASKSVLGA